VLADVDNIPGDSPNASAHECNARMIDGYLNGFCD
jgi:hypothetical protein